MKTILVTGDLIRDYNLVRSPRGPAHYRETVPHTLLQERGGGAGPGRHRAVRCDGRRGGAVA